MTARKVTLIAYDFAPHGIRLRQALVFTQKLLARTLRAQRRIDPAGYYADPSLLTLLGGLCPNCSAAR
jgi:hypothetical protein